LFVYNLTMNYQTAVFTIVNIQQPYRHARQPWIITVDFASAQTIPWTNSKGIAELFWSKQSRLCATTFQPLKMKAMTTGMKAVAVISIFDSGPVISEIMLLEQMVDMPLDYTLQPRFNIDKSGSGIGRELIRIFQVKTLKEICIAQVKPEDIKDLCI